MARILAVVARALLPATAFAGAVLVGCQKAPVHPELVSKLPPPKLNAVQPTTRPLSPPPPLTPHVHAGRRPATRPAVTEVPKGWVPAVPANPWRWIVIHHSATPHGNAATFDREHRAKGWDELGYHFVIGNGTFSGNGVVEVGSRWAKQKWGAHAKTPDQQFNNFGIGICLVGNFDVDRPSTAQVQALAKLTAYLMRTYRIPADRIIGHGQTKPTDCPGRNCSIAEVRQLAAQMAGVADGGTELHRDTRIARSGELMHTVGTR